ncbi:cob(I)yrinic acid a,c-diamide adenosyltransferase [Veillonella sp. DNF00869]|nr:cob(I)yrinic acid a,c-diamide adenosyltransferase [Veillonella sp. DNF00869]
MGFPYILRKVERQMGEGLILVNTGDGKGKTTAALGVALRSAGCGRRVLILQFIKSGANYGELAGIALLPTVEIRSMGKGFIFHKQDESEEKMKEHQQAAKEAWAMVETEVKSGQWDLIILDEINYAIHYGLVDVETVVNLLKTKPENLDMILTGRNARPEIIELAHTVTEMKVIKHAYQQGIKAKRGIEF